MAKTTRNTYDDSKSYTSVIVQRGSPALDADLNEQHDIAYTHQVEGLRAGSMTQRHSAARGRQGVSRYWTYGQAGPGEWSVDVVGATTPVLRAGTIFVDGVRVVLPGDIPFAGQPGISFAPALTTFGILYAQIVNTEIDSSEDPSIATPEMGESAVRKKTLVTLKQATSTTSYADALDQVLAPNNVAGAAYWKNHVLTVILAKYTQAGGATTVAATDLMCLVEPTPAEITAWSKLTYLGQGTLWSEDTGDWDLWTGSTHQDSSIVWNATAGRLLLGNRHAEAQSALSGKPAVEIAATLDRHGKTILLHPPGTAENFGSPGTRMAQDWTTNGMVIADGNCIGFIPERDGSSVLARNNPLDSASVFQWYDPTANIGASAATRMTLASAHPREFSQPGAFILCARFGRDLVWWNGHITRGRKAGTVTDTITRGGKADDVVLSGDGSSDIGGVFGLLHAMKFNRSATTTDAATSRSLRIRIRRGVWSLGTSLPATRYGLTVSANVYNGLDDNSIESLSNFELLGDSMYVTRIDAPQLVIPQANLGDYPAILSINADVVTMKNFTMIAGNATSVPGAGVLPLLSINARVVHLEGIQFNGQVRITAEVVTVRDCKFYSESGGVEPYYVNQALFAETPASCLYLAQRANNNGASSERWTISNCEFHDLRKISTCGLLIIGETGTAMRPKVTVKDCRFNHNGYGNIPSIGIHTQNANIRIFRNQFYGSIGSVITSIASGVVGNQGNTNGTPMRSVAAIATTYYSCMSYISCPVGRAATSSLIVEHNRFDLKDVNAVTANAYSQGWGAMIIMPGPYAASQAVVVANVQFNNNYVDVSNSQWQLSGANATLRKTYLWGCYISVSQGFRSIVPTVVVKHIRMNDNHFEIGVGARAWRASMGSGTSTWDSATDPGTYDSACLLGVSLKLASNGSFIVTGRMASDIEIDRNKFMTVVSPSSWIGTKESTSTTTGDRAVAPVYILVCSNSHATVNGVNDDGGTCPADVSGTNDTYLNPTSDGISNVFIRGNQFLPTVSSSATLQGLINIGGVNQCHVSGNTLLSTAAADGCLVHCSGSTGLYIVANNIGTRALTFASIALGGTGKKFSIGANIVSFSSSTQGSDDKQLFDQQDNFYQH